MSVGYTVTRFYHNVLPNAKGVFTQLSALDERQRGVNSSHRRNPLGEIDQPDLSALAALLDPISKMDFINGHWERSPLLVNRDPPEWLGRLLAVSDVDSLISLTNNGGSEDVRVAKSRDETVEHLPIARGSDGRPELPALFRAYHDGYTIIVNGLHRRWPSISLLSAKLSEELGHSIGVNLYLTPSQAQGFQPHVDGHDVFILQIDGEKDWEVYCAPVELPLEDQKTEFSLQELGPPVLSGQLTPGDVLYIPRGFVHRARTGRPSSLHLTIGVHAWRWIDVLHRAVDEMARNHVDLRRAVPGDWAPSELAGRTSELLEMLTKTSATRRCARMSSAPWGRPAPPLAASSWPSTASERWTSTLS